MRNGTVKLELAPVGSWWQVRYYSDGSWFYVFQSSDQASAGAVYEYLEMLNKLPSQRAALQRYLGALESDSA